MPGFCICKCCTRFWKWLNNVLWQASKYVWSTFHSVLNYPLVQYMPGVRIWQGCEYARVAQGAEYAWISLNMPWLCPNIREFALITLNMIELTGIYLKSVEYTWILNMPDLVQNIRSLYKLQSSYRDRDVFRTLPNI